MSTLAHAITLPFLQQHLYTSIDSSVKPIVRNKKIEKPKPLVYDADAFPFQALDPKSVLSLTEQEGAIESFLSEIYASIGGGDPCVDAIVYLQELSRDTEMANLILNSSFMALLVKCMRRAKRPPVRIAFLSLMGYLFRHATYITDHVASVGLVDALVDAIAQAQGQEVMEKVAVASLGELLFYIVSREEGIEPWVIPPSAVQAITQTVLSASRPSKTLAYAVQTIHNVMVKPDTVLVPNGGPGFASLDVALALATLLPLAASTLAATITNALSRICRADPSLAPHLVAETGVDWLITPLPSGSAKVAGAVLNILALALCEGDGASQMAIISARGLLPDVVACLAHKSPDVVLKALAVMAVVASVSSEGLLMLLELRAGPVVENAPPGEWKDELVLVMASAVNGIVSRVGSANDESNVPALKSALVSFPAVGLALDAPILAHAINVHAFLKVSGCLLATLSDATYVSSTELRAPLFAALGALSAHRDLMREHSGAVSEHVLKPLFGLLQGGDAERRFLSLRLVSDVLLGLPPRLPDVRELLGTFVFPSAQALLEDEAPIPVYTLRLLDALVERDPSLAGSLHDRGLLPVFVSFFSLTNALNNVHNVSAMGSVIQSPDVPLGSLCADTIVPALADVLRYAVENDVTAFMQPLLRLMVAILGRAVGGVLAHVNPTSASEANISDLPGDLDPELDNLVSLCFELTDLLPVVFPLLDPSSDPVVGEEGDVADMAAEALTLLYKMYGPSLYDTLFAPPYVDILIRALETLSSKTVVLKLLKILGWVFDSGFVVDGGGKGGQVVALIETLASHSDADIAGRGLSVVGKRLRHKR